MAITLSRHKQWTPYDPSDIGASGYAKGTSRHKGKQMGMDVLTGRRLDPQLQKKWDNFEKQYAGVSYGNKQGGQFARKIKAQRELERQTLQAGYSLADLGKEQYVGGGMAGWGHWLPRVENMGWSYDAELGSWRHTSWGDDVSWGDYQDVGYDQYLQGLPQAGAGMLEAGSEGYAGGEDTAGATGGAPGATPGAPVFTPGAPPAAPPGGATQTFTPAAATGSGASFSAAPGGASRGAPSATPMATVPNAWASTGAPGGGGGGLSPSPSSAPSGKTNLFSQPEFFGGKSGRGKGWSGGGQWIGSDRDIKDLGLEKPRFSDYRR